MAIYHFVLKETMIIYKQNIINHFSQQAKLIDHFYTMIKILSKIGRYKNKGQTEFMVFLERLYKNVFRIIPYMLK